MKPKVISSEKLFKGAIFDLYRLSIKLANGVVANREIIKKSDSITMLVVNEDNKVLIEYEYRSPLYKTVAGFPAGLIKKAEDPYVTARRELQEETGLLVDPKAFKRVGIYTLSEGFTDERSHVFIVRLTNNNYKMVKTDFDDDEYIGDWKWVSLNSAENQVHSAAANLAIKEFRNISNK